MKINRLVLLTGMALLIVSAQAQETQKKLPFFDNIVISPKINVVLIQGEKESIRIVYSNVSAAKINARVSGETLQLFLEGARIVDKREHFYHDDNSGQLSVYRNAVVTAYVTYTKLRRLEVRGEEEITCNSSIVGDKFTLKAYGQSDITFDSIQVEDFRIVMYGENKLKVKSGTANQQTYRLYGENKIDTRALRSIDASTSIYGEGKLALYVSNQFRISAFGEPIVEILGSPSIHKGIMIGRASITKNKRD